MVTRKPVPSSGIQTTQDAEQLPYPVTPTSPWQEEGSFPSGQQTSSTVQPQDHDMTAEESSKLQPGGRAPIQLDLSDDWVDAGDNREDDGSSLPAPLRVAKAKASAESTKPSKQEPEIPPLLRVGHLEGTPRTSSESQRSYEKISLEPEMQGQATSQQNFQATRSNNPFHRGQSVEKVPQTHNQPQEESSADIWAELSANPTPSTSHPPPFPMEPSLHGFSDLTRSETPASQPNFESRPPNNNVAQYNADDSLIALDGTNQYQKELHASPFASDPVDNRIETTHSDISSKHNIPVVDHALPRPPPEESGPGQSEYMPQDTINLPPPQPPRPAAVEDHRPQLPTRSASFESRAQKQRSETYEIKHIRWLDAQSSEVRTTPILVQNANGPCPLLALVNALTLSTPPTLKTALVETLRVREQVSLGLLLDAVFDELMSGRRGDAAQELPDVGELYTFLITLHTGMNVNPRFIPITKQIPSLVDGLEDPDVSLSLHDHRKPGGFEETKEMSLYSTFAIPLIHGWLPPVSHPAFNALKRSANSYEDAQNLLFREEELEDKVQQTGLSADEQQLLEDIATIKYFLSSAATQLTGYGLDTITESLALGSIAILFRNDHFGTLYRNPRTGQLLHLVTDMGYAGHEEVVWESLVDVSGEGSEFFSGDFRPVGHQASSTVQQSYNYGQQDESGWTTVGRSGRQNFTQRVTPSNQNTLAPQEPEYNIPPSNNTEQEDADLALAMQLQEEEDDRSRRTAEDRRREDDANAAYLYSQNVNGRSPTQSNRRTSTSNTPNPTPGRTSQTVRPLIPPRRDNPAAASSSSVRPPVHRPTPSSDEDVPPPSYEEAAKTSPYHPPISQSSHTTGVSRDSGASTQHGTRPRGQSAYSQTAAKIGGSPALGRRTSGVGGSGGGFGDGSTPSAVGRRRSAGPGQGPMAPVGERRGDKDCLVM